MSTGAGYDYSVTTFSPDGRVFQVEYAEKAADKAGTVIGVKCIDGVVLGVEKSITSKLLVQESNKRIFPLGLYSSMAISGLMPDGRALANDARGKVREYYEFYGSEIPGQVLAERIAGRIHNTTIYWPERPFGCCSVISTYDEVQGPGLYMIRPNGELHRYYAIAVGRHKQGARTELEKIKFDQITCKQAVELIAMIMYKLHDDVKDKDFELELTWQTEATQFKVQHVPRDIRDSAVTVAKAAKERALMADSDSDDE